MDSVYSQAFTEVLEILKNSEKNIVSRIPENFIEFLNKYKDNNYKAEIDFSNENWDEQVKKETQAILALIYRDFIVSKEKREKLLAEEQEEQIRIENELREKYNPDNLFKNETNNIINNSKNTVEMVKYKESILKKIIIKIQNIFAKK